MQPGQALLALVPLQGAQRRRTELGGQRPSGQHVFQLFYRGVQWQALLVAFVAAFRLIALIFFLLMPLRKRAPFSCAPLFSVAP